MDEIIIRDGEPIDIVADASLDGAQVKTEWRDGELHITWHRDGNILAGIVLSEEHARLLDAVIRLALAEKERQ